VRLPEFLTAFADEISDAVVRSYPPLYDAETRRSCGFDLRRLMRKPLGAQADAIRATALSIQRQRATIVVGEMGSGKSAVAAAAAYLAGSRRVFLVCPPHRVRNWKREIELTVPGARVAIVRTIRDLERTRDLGGPIQFVVCSREQSKLGYRWTPVAVARIARGPDGAATRDETGAVARLLCCPSCFAPIVDDEGVPLGWADLGQKKRRCDGCGGHAVGTGPDRTAPGRRSGFVVPPRDARRADRGADDPQASTPTAGSRAARGRDLRLHPEPPHLHCARPSCRGGRAGSGDAARVPRTAHGVPAEDRRRARCRSSRSGAGAAGRRSRAGSGPAARRSTADEPARTRRAARSCAAP
jgi:hypothetical protein